MLASTYLDDAIHCRNINFVPEREETRSYRLYKSRPLTALVYVAVVAICLLALFERPALNRYAIKSIMLYLSRTSLQGDPSDQRLYVVDLDLEVPPCYANLGRFGAARAE